MQNHIKVIIKEPGKAPYYDAIPNELEIFQKYVDGYIETVTIEEDLVVICDEEGRLNGKPMNVRIANVDFCGTVIIAGVDGDQFTDIPMLLRDSMTIARVLLMSHLCCPGCGKWYKDRPAISRKDNKTEICPDCGTYEAIKARAKFVAFSEKRKKAHDRRAKTSDKNL